MMNSYPAFKNLNKISKTYPYDNKIFSIVYASGAAMVQKKKPPAHPG